MIKVERTEKVESLQKYEAKWIQKIKDALDLTAKATTKEEKEKAMKKLELAINKYKQEDVKEILAEKMFHGKCS